METVALGVGELVFGVRVNGPEASRLVRSGFSSAVLEDAGAPASYSLVVLDDGGPTGGHRRNGLYEGHRWVSVDERPAAIVEQLAQRLAACAPVPPGRVRLEAVTVRGAAGVTVVAGLAGATVAGLRRHAETSNVLVGLGPVEIDGRTRAVHLPPVAGAPFPDWLTAVVVPGDHIGAGEGRSGAAAAEPWLFVGPGEDPEDVASDAQPVLVDLPVVTAPPTDLAEIAIQLAQAPDHRSW